MISTMGIFTNAYCPLCGSNKSQDSFKKSFIKMPFGRVIESLGRGTLKTLRVIVNPSRINLKPVKIRLLKVFKNWFESGIITCRDIDDYLIDIISEYNEWRENTIQKSETYRMYAKKDSYPVFRAGVSVSGDEKSSMFGGNSITKRIDKSWK